MCVFEISFVFLCYKFYLFIFQDLDKDSNVVNKMIVYMKANNVKKLKCAKCGDEKKSALGYLSHKKVSIVSRSYL